MPGTRVHKDICEALSYISMMDGNRFSVRAQVAVVRIACTCGREYASGELGGLVVCEHCGARMGLGHLDVSFSSETVLTTPPPVHHAGAGSPAGVPARFRVVSHGTPAASRPAGPAFPSPPGSYMHETCIARVKVA